MGQAAADGSTVADRQMRDLRHGRGNDREARRDDRGCLHLVVPRQRTDREAALCLLDAIEPGDAVDIDQDGRPDQTEVEHGHEALPAREQLSIRAGPRKGRDGVVDTRCAYVVEGGRFHGFDGFDGPSAWGVRSVASGIASHSPGRIMPRTGADGGSRPRTGFPPQAAQDWNAETRIDIKQGTHVADLDLSPSRKLGKLQRLVVPGDAGLSLTAANTMAH